MICFNEAERVINKIATDSVDFEASLDPVLRKDTGSYYTGFELAFSIVEELMSFVNKTEVVGKKFLEPCVGTGNFVFAYLVYCYGLNLSQKDYKKIVDNIYACDINHGALEIYERNLKYLCKELFSIDLNHDYFEKHIGSALVFNMDDEPIHYVSLEDVFDKTIIGKGFDIIVTNPPYKNIKAERTHYLTNEEYDAVRTKYKDVGTCARKHLRYSVHGSLNLYKFFVEEIVDKYLAPNGISSLLIPSSIVSDKTCEQLRTHLINTCAIRSIRLLAENTPYLLSQQALCVVLFEKGQTTKEITIDGSFDGNTNSGTRVPIEYILDPATGNSFLILSEEEFKMRSLMLRYPTIKELPFISNLRGELDLSFDNKYINENNTPYLLCRGRNIALYKLIYNERVFHVDPVFVKLCSKNKYIFRERLACQQIANLAKEKRLCFTLVPPNTILGNSCNFISVEENDYGIDDYFMLGILNSSLMEWFFRLTSSNNHISNYEINSFPIPVSCSNKDAISLTVKEYLRTHDENLLPEIDRLVCTAYGVSEIQKKRNVSKTNPDFCDTLSLNLYSDLKCVIPCITEKESKSLIDGATSIEELCLKKLPAASKFDKKVLSSIVEKYKKLHKNEILNHTTFKLSKLDLEMIEHVPQGGSWKDIPQEIVSKSKRLEKITQTGGRTTLYGRIDYSRPSYTITTYFSRPGNGTYVHPIHQRVLSVREAARFQSFPDDFYFYGNKTDMLDQVGNAVPVLLAYCIGERIKNVIGCSKSIDLFSGAGGLTLGLDMAGIKAVVANDINESACVTLKTNLPKIDVICGDITNQDTKNHIIGKGLENKIDMICGGPPCQGFSLAGFRKDDDPRNELFKQFVDIVSQTLPKVVLFENVEGLLSYKGGETYQDIIKLFSQLNYNAEGRTLLASEYGVPQKRKRVIIICVRKDIEIMPSELYPEKILPEPDKQVTAYETIYDLENISCEDCAKYSAEYSSNFTKYVRREISISQYFENLKNIK